MLRNNLDNLFGVHNIGNVYWGMERPGITYISDDVVVLGIPVCSQDRFQKFWPVAQAKIGPKLRVLNTQHGIPLSDGSVIQEEIYSISEEAATELYERFDEIIAVV